MGNVVRLPKRTQAISYTPAFNEAWRSYPDSGRTRSSRIESAGEWQKITREVGEDALLAAVRKYAAEDKDHRKECGAPAFHRWLKNGRWDYWLDASKTVAPPKSVRRFPNEELRQAFVERFQNERAIRWFDACAFNEVTREIINPGWELRAEWVNGPFRKWAMANRVSALVT